MDLEQLQDLAEKDLKINDTELDLESLKTPQLHNKYLKFLNKWKLLQTKANIDYYKLRKEKWEYYTGKAPQQVYAEKPFNLKILKTDIDKYMESDDELVKLKSWYFKCKILAKFSTNISLCFYFEIYFV